MIDIKKIKSNPEILRKNNEMRNIDDNTNEILDCYAKLCNIKTEYQSLLEIKNRMSKNREVFTDKEKLNTLSEKLRIVDIKFNDMISRVPNILSDNVHYGQSEDDNNIYFESPCDFKKTQPHNKLTKKIDREAGSKLTGSRFFVLHDEVAFLYRKLANFMIDYHVSQGYTEHHVPVIINKEAAYNSGQMSSMSDDMFCVEDNYLLSPTAEVQLVNLMSDKKITELPLKFVALTSCFRKESGAAGKDTTGILRTHQFEKVELVKMTQPENSDEELKNMLKNVSEIFNMLEVPYRIVELCSGDTGFASSKTYDFEAWMAGSGKYREISSCSNCTDFQARRMHLKYKGNLLHTLNGSGTAVGRMLIALIENHYIDGKIILPAVLADYCKKQSINL